MVEIFCLKCKKRTETINLTEIVARNNKKQIKGKWKICGTKKCQFVKNTEITDNILQKT